MKNQDVIEYPKFPGFESIFLEDSFVLRIDEGQYEIAFLLEVVLLPGHVQFTEPSSEESHCYVKGRLEFSNIRHCQWNHKHLVPILDADGSADFGSIDYLYLRGENYVLGGDWGELELISDSPRIRLFA